MSALQTQSDTYQKRCEDLRQQMEEHAATHQAALRQQEDNEKEKETQREEAVTALNA